MNLHPSKLPMLDREAAGLDTAECLYDPELHTGPRRTIETAEEAAAREEAAREVCLSCPVLAQCLARAMQIRPSRGVWGALPAAMLSDLFAGLSAPSLKEAA
ncbi:WhiB family transcriptional regulator [Spirillospora sp. NPDC127200]